MPTETATIEKPIKLKHDLLIDIADFASLTAIEVKENKKIMYSDFINGLRTPKITSRKGNAGGYVGGFVEGERKNANVLTRSILTLDIDDAQGITVWENVENYSKFAAFLYSTHNSTPENPRYRLIVPLSREIAPGEYAAAAQFMADLLKVKADNVSKTLSQIMYYPTCPNPEYYETQLQDLPFFNPDEVPDNYGKSAGEIARGVSGNSKKHDPREKKNWIGAWCNVYTITDVLETFLPDAYTPFNGKDRYTYLGGSAQGGAIVYDENTHFHSNHDTDPISGMNVNSFDLLRIHKFGQLDQGQDDMKDKPSYKAMVEFCQNDDQVKAFYDDNIDFDFGILVKDSESVDLQKELKARRFEELAFLEQAWEENGKKGQRPNQIKPIRCSIILKEYISFALFDLEENTRLAMYMPKEGIYTRNETVIRRIISWLEPSLNAKAAGDVIYHLRNSSEVVSKTESRYRIPVKNGVFNLETKKLEPFSPAYVFTTKIATPYIESEKVPEINGWNVEDWLKSIACNDQEIVHLLWQVINDAMNGNYTRKKAIFLIGEGNNGKGTFQELITNLIGLQNIATIKVNEFDKPFRLGVLEGKTAAIGDDVPANVFIDDSANFNSVVTGDVVSVEHKNKDPYNTVFRCSVIQSTNRMPSFKNKTTGTIRRLVIVPFNADFNGEVENVNIKDEYIRNEEVLQYVLQKAIHMDFEKFTIPKASVNELEIFKQDNDPLLDFKLTVFDEWSIQRVPKYVVYGFYKKFCNDNGYKFLSDRKFHKEFKKLVGKDWNSEAQFRYNYEVLMEQLGDLDVLGISFPASNTNQKSYENTRLKVV